MTETGEAEIRSMKYKSMLLKQNCPKLNTKHSLHIDDYLEKERISNKDERWIKLDKSIKLEKLGLFVDAFAVENNLNAADKLCLNEFLINSLNEKKISKTKDVVYDKQTGVIKTIPCLVYCPNAAKRYTFKRSEKRQSTLKSLSVPKHHPKKPNKQPVGVDPTTGVDSTTGVDPTPVLNVNELSCIH